MRIEFDRETCDGWFQCTQEWDEFSVDAIAGKAELNGAEEQNGRFVREVPDGDEAAARAAARTCPVNAIRISDDGD